MSDDPPENPIEIKTEADYLAAKDRFLGIMLDGNSSFPEYQSLSAAIEAYEEKHFPIDPPSPDEARRFRRDQMKLKRHNWTLGTALIALVVLAGSAWFIPDWYFGEPVAVSFDDDRDGDLVGYISHDGFEWYGFEWFMDPLTTGTLFIVDEPWDNLSLLDESNQSALAVLWTPPLVSTTTMTITLHNPSITYTIEAPTSATLRRMVMEGEHDLIVWFEEVEP